MQQSIPLNAVSNQTLTVNLNRQQCKINLYQRNGNLYFDLSVDGKNILKTVLCLNYTSLINKSYVEFTGNLYFVDTTGSNDPEYTGLGTRYLLIYEL